MFAPPPPRLRAPRWARGGHAQTILGACFRGAPEPYEDPALGYRAVRVPLGDCEALAGHHRRGERGWSVLLLHGLGGSTRSSYLRRAAARAAARGWGALALDFRGSGGARESVTRPYMTGNTSDVADALAWLRRENPGDRILAVGYSLGGNTLLLHLGRGSGEQPDLALCVQPAVDLERTSRALLAWPAHLYDLAVLRSCRRWIPRLRGPGPDPPRYRVSPFASLRAFDRDYIAPVWGFASREQYYAEASSAPWLRRIGVPTVLLATADDPLIELASVSEAPRSPAVDLHVLPSGGHLGFLAARRSPLGSRRWDEWALEHYLAAAEAFFPPRCTSSPRSPRTELPLCAP